MTLERVAIVGVGRIGLCLALNLDAAGYRVLGVDAGRRRVERIRDRTLRVGEPGVVQALRRASSLRVTDRLADLREHDPELVFVAVPTTTAEVGGYDHALVNRVLDDLFGLALGGDRIDLALVCTTLPGYCDSVAGAAGEHGFVLSYAPTFVAQGSIMRDQQYPSQVLIGEGDAAAGDRLEGVFRKLTRNEPEILRMVPLSAEIAKLATNCALTMKIAFANAIGDLASQVGAEPEPILAAVGADARIGSGFLRHGFGYGGPCLPRDNRALGHFARRHGMELPQAEATDESNRRHLEFQLDQYLRTHAEDEPIHFDSVTYKPGTDILEESQPLRLAVELARAGRRVVIRDRPAVLETLRERYGDLFEYRT